MIGAQPVPETLASRAATLFSAYRAGDSAKMGELVTLLTPILWHTVRAQRVEQTLAEDVLQTTWLALVRGAGSISDPQAVLQWLIVSARREAWRVVKREDRVEPREIELDTVVSAAERPDELAVRADEDARLWRHVVTLPERCRALLRVIAFADRPDYAEVAEALAMPIGSIGPTRGRCLAKLRLQLANDPEWVSSSQSDLAAAPLDAEDSRLLARMAALYAAADPVPAGLVGRIEFALTLDALHAEVAELQRSADLAGVRSAEATEARSVTFASSNLTVMITITPLSPESVRLDGWAAPGGGVTVELRTASGTVQARADADGRFVFEPVPRGLARLLLTPPEGTAEAPVVTPSIEL